MTSSADFTAGPAQGLMSSAFYYDSSQQPGAAYFPQNTVGQTGNFPNQSSQDPNLCYSQPVDWKEDKDDKKDGEEEKSGVAAVYPWMTRVHSSSDIEHLMNNRMEYLMKNRKTRLPLSITEQESDQSKDATINTRKQPENGG
uniref:Homeobox protein Hox-B5 n=1 Tax=Heterorhabditis bacteriophora TaxID=37862 RepID=A0A1I7XCY1_HETBA